MMIPLQPEWVLAHPHDNMEIITIPLEGDLAHKDSMGNTEIIRNGDVQVMSAGGST
jgi:redox-sensitive bicupin YhaK (pirin superfamily)